MAADQLARQHLIGMPRYAELWPGIQEELFNDFGRLHELTGDWDMVLFTGDLAYGGAAAEFEQVERLLDSLWERFRELGFNSKRPIWLLDAAKRSSPHGR